MSGRLVLAIVFCVAGVLHFVVLGIYLRIMPPYLPWHRMLIALSGAAEVLGGLGLLVPFARRGAAWGLVALLIAVWPANLYMAMAHLPAAGVMGQSWAQWLRLPLQVPLLWWTWRYTRP